MIFKTMRKNINVASEHFKYELVSRYLLEIGLSNNQTFIVINTSREHYRS